MQLAHIVPNSLLNLLPSNQYVHLALAPLVVSDSTYCRFYRTKLNKGHHVILDNPVHEDMLHDPGTWLQAAGMLRPTIAIAPDVIDDDSLTVKYAATYGPVVKRHYYTQVMAVPHGETQHDFFHCASALARIPEIDWLGISLERRLHDDERALARRYERLQYLSTNRKFDRLKIHLLGTSESALEFTEDVYDWSRAASTDTSKFAVFQLTGNPVSPPVPVTVPYPGREPLGGSFEYFHAHPQLTTTEKHQFTRNLAEWCAYSERNDYRK